MIVIVSILSIDGKEDFFKGSNRNTVAFYFQLIKLFVKVLEELLKYASLLLWNHKSYFT
jgi:hypothetical protein